MGPLTASELSARLATPQVRKYAQAVDRESARETLAAKSEASREGDPERAAPGHTGAGKEAPSTFERILTSSLTRSIAGQLTRSLMGALLGPARRRR